MIRYLMPGYLNYYDACLEGLKSVHTSLQMGTPGEGCKGSRSTICMVRMLNGYAAVVCNVLITSQHCFLIQCN